MCSNNQREESSQNWEKLYCYTCGRVVVYFQPGAINEDEDFKLYCCKCADIINKGTM